MQEFLPGNLIIATRVVHTNTIRASHRLRIEEGGIAMIMSFKKRRNDSKHGKQKVVLMDFTGEFFEIHCDDFSFLKNMFVKL